MRDAFSVKEAETRLQQSGVSVDCVGVAGLQPGGVPDAQPQRVGRPAAGAAPRQRLRRAARARRQRLLQRRRGGRARATALPQTNYREFCFSSFTFGFSPFLGNRPTAVIQNLMAS